MHVLRSNTPRSLWTAFGATPSYELGNITETTVSVCNEACYTVSMLD